MPPLYNILCKFSMGIDSQRKHIMFFKGLVEQATELRKNQQVYLIKRELCHQAKCFDHFSFPFQERDDLLQLLLNAHKDTEISDTEQFLEYENKTRQGIKRGTNIRLNKEIKVTKSILVQFCLLTVFFLYLWTPTVSFSASTLTTAPRVRLYNEGARYVTIKQMWNNLQWIL